MTFTKGHLFGKRFSSTYHPGKGFQEGHTPWNKGNGIRKMCIECNKEFVVRPCREKTAMYCSKKCAGKQRTNISLYQKTKWEKLMQSGYVPISSKDRLERIRFRHEMQKSVFERDSYTCQICGTHKDLQVDHIQKWSDYVELRFNMDNCRTLCKSCHYQITFGRPIPDEKMEWGHNLGRVRIDP